MMSQDKFNALEQAFKAYAKDYKAYQRKSVKRSEMRTDTHTQKRIQNAEADLNWAAMDLDKHDDSNNKLCELMNSKFALRETSIGAVPRYLFTDLIDNCATWSPEMINALYDVVKAYQGRSK